ncbi:hypothetical protein [Terrimonas alba]|uniref:hypothetical protein n=1 Tax=Terrimonas alba TaxID=3349636 RepID=UPI0035F4D368
MFKELVFTNEGISKVIAQLSLMKSARLSIVTENQNALNKAEKLANLISATLTTEPDFHIEKYEKFENSYKLDFVIRFEGLQSSIIESIEKTDRLCSPWNVRLNRSQNEIELTFNKSANATFSKNEFNVIVWANWAVNE